ncbi:hypothetical protein Taro_013383 [Colocasia esculenta]|uniref:Uncharacterized protein n=1 Tax=Colocasia esculenta TaxID=4460 RepID=A0A843ULZ8_COLES|nr:hypothetical protein [Colocasia esculenta]
MKAKHFLNGLKPQYITQLAPLDIQTYAEMVEKAQLLEDATDFTDRIKGKFVKKKLTPGLTTAKPNIGKKHPFSIMEGPSQEKKPKVIIPTTPEKSNCKHCDKPGHTTDECWRKVGACLHYGSREHGAYRFCHGSVDTPTTGVDTGFQTLRQNDEEMVKRVDTASSSVDIRPSAQRTQLTGPYSVSTQPQVVSTLDPVPRGPVCHTGTVCRHSLGVCRH